MWTHEDVQGTVSLSLGPSNFVLLCALHTVVGHHQILGSISKYFTISLFLLHVHHEVVLITVKCFFNFFSLLEVRFEPFCCVRGELLLSDVRIS